MLIWLCFWVQSYCKSSYHGAGQPWSDGLMLQVSFGQNTNDAKVCHSLQLHSLLCCWSSHDELPVKQTERSDRCVYLLHGHQSSPIHTNWRVQSKDCILKQSKTRPCTTAPSVKVDFNNNIYVYTYIRISIGFNGGSRCYIITSAGRKTHALPPLLLRLRRGLHRLWLGCSETETLAWLSATQESGPWGTWW